VIKNVALGLDCHLTTLDKPRTRGTHRGHLLMIPPLSGHCDTLLGDLVHGLLATTNISILNVADPAKSALPKHQNGILRQTEQVKLAWSCAKAHDPDTGVFAACQSTAATLQAIDDLGDDGPKTLVLMAAPIGNTSRGGVGGSLHKRGLAKFEKRLEPLLQMAPNGSMILPGSKQLAAIMVGAGGASRILRFESILSLSLMIPEERRALAQLRSQILTQTQALDANLIAGGIESNFFTKTPDLSNAGIRDLLLIAGEIDGVIPEDQVFVGSTVLDAGSIKMTLVPQADHFDLFCSDLARGYVGPRIGTFLNSVLRSRMGQQS
jgi:hypothetical protein